MKCSVVHGHPRRLVLTCILGEKTAILMLKHKNFQNFMVNFEGVPNSLQMVAAAMKLKDLLLERKAMTSIDSILKSRDITLPTKVHVIKAMVFLVVIYGCESWTIK